MIHHRPEMADHSDSRHVTLINPFFADGGPVHLQSSPAGGFYFLPPPINHSLEPTQIINRLSMQRRLHIQPASKCSGRLAFFGRPGYISVGAKNEPPRIDRDGQTKQAPLKYMGRPGFFGWPVFSSCTGITRYHN